MGADLEKGVHTTLIRPHQISQKESDFLVTSIRIHVGDRRSLRISNDIVTILGPAIVKLQNSSGLSTSEYDRSWRHERSRLYDVGKAVDSMVFLHIHALCSLCRNVWMLPDLMCYLQTDTCKCIFS